MWLFSLETKYILLVLDGKRKIGGLLMQFSCSISKIEKWCASFIIRITFSVHLYYFHATANALLSSGSERMFWTLESSSWCLHLSSIKTKSIMHFLLLLLVAFSLFHIDVNEYSQISFTSEQFLKFYCCTLL